MVDNSTLKNYNIMDKQKLNYLAPEAETLVIRFEENIMSPQMQSNGVQSANAKNASNYDFDSWGDM